MIVIKYIDDRDVVCPAKDDQELLNECKELLSSYKSNKDIVNKKIEILTKQELCILIVRALAVQLEITEEIEIHYKNNVFKLGKRGRITSDNEKAINLPSVYNDMLNIMLGII